MSKSLTLPRSLKDSSLRKSVLKVRKKFSRTRDYLWTQHVDLLQSFLRAFYKNWPLLSLCKNYVLCVVHLRQDRNKPGNFLGNWNGEPETDG